MGEEVFDLVVLSCKAYDLDAALRVGMRMEISELHARLKTTMIYVTHDQVEAMTMADRIVVLDFGSKLCEGVPSAIRSDERVQEAYLGSVLAEQQVSAAGA